MEKKIQIKRKIVEQFLLYNSPFEIIKYVIYLLNYSKISDRNVTIRNKLYHDRKYPTERNYEVLFDIIYKSNQITDVSFNGHGRISFLIVIFLSEIFE